MKWKKAVRAKIFIGLLVMILVFSDNLAILAGAEKDTIGVSALEGSVSEESTQKHSDIEDTIGINASEEYIEEFSEVIEAADILKDDIQTEEQEEYWRNEENELLVQFTKSSEGEFVCGDYIYILDGDENAEIVRYTGSDSDVIIPSVLDGHSVTTIGGFAFQKCSSLKTIELPKNLREVGGYAFMEAGLTRIAFPSQVEVIEHGAFMGCEHLQEVDFSDSIKELGNGSFSSCNELRNLELPHYLETIGDGVFTSPYIEEICIPKTLKGSSSAFYGCKNLKKMVLEEGMERVPSCLAGNVVSLERVEMPESVTVIGNFAFQKCSSLKTVELPKNLRKVEGYAFMDCSGLNFIYFKGEAPNIEENAFYKVIATAYYFPENITWNKEIMQDYGGTLTWKEWDGSKLSTVVGTLQSIDLNQFTIQIDNKNYSVNDEFDMNIATEILMNHESKVVIARLKENEIVSMNDIMDVIYPKIELSSSTGSITYLNGKIDTKKLTGKTTISLAIRSPYTMADLNEAKDKNLVSLELETMHLDATSGYGLYFEKGGLFSPNKISVDKKIDTTLKPGEVKEYSFDVYVQDDYKPEVVSEFLQIESSVSFNGEKYTDTLAISAGNVDLQREQQESERAKRESSQAISNAEKALENVNMAIDDTLLREYFTAPQVKDIKKQMTIWVSQIIATSVLVRNDNNGVIETIRKKTGLDQNSIMKKALGKLGINENLFTTIGNTKATTKIVVPGKDIAIYCSVNLNFNAFKESPPYAGFGTLDYYIMDNGEKRNALAKGIITYTNINTFVEQLQKIAESNIKSVYGDIWGKDADKVAEMIVGETLYKVLKKTTGGTFSDNVFTLFANQTTNYTRKISVHCPVDVYVYDADGMICGIIKDNIVDPSYDSIYMYVDGEEKYFYLTEDDYTIQFLGNGTGEMQYTVEEYSEEGLLRRVEYHDIPLEAGKEYYSSIPGAVYLDHVVYDPIADSGDTLDSDKDTWQDNLEKRVSTDGVILKPSEISLSVGDEYKLIANVTPANATNQEVDWISLDETVASVTKEGLVKAIAEGETYIQVSTVDGGFTADCRIIVVPKTDYLPDIIKGDLNLDGKITMPDLLMCLHHVSGRNTLSGNAFLSADVNEDGKVTMVDLLRILHYVSGRNKEL